MSNFTKIVASTFAAVALAFGSVAVASPVTVQASFKTVHCC